MFNKKTNVLLAVLGAGAMLAMAVVLQAFVLKPASSLKLAPLPAGEYDPAVWGNYYPLEYESYRKNREMTPSPTGFGGSEKVQKSVKEPEILMNFKGMPFSIDYAEDRGHPCAIDDLKTSRRVNSTTVGSCMTCKTATIIDTFKDKGWDYAKMPLAELFPLMKHPVSCVNCHDPATMRLRVANPAFLEAMQRKGVEVDKASRADMRSYVCGQCHAEYYFEPATKRVVFPWDKGYTPEQMYAYYAEKPAGFEQDWIHPDSQARMLKSQHPDFETWSGGVHAGSGVACADCHMPFLRHKGQKYSSHWVTSPLKHIQASCTTCHAQDEAWLLDRVRTIQNNVFEMQHIAGQAVAQAHAAIGKAAAGAGRADLGQARELLRQAQWFWDTVASENGMGFHNSTQALNTLGRATDMAYRAAAMANKAAGAR